MDAKEVAELIMQAGQFGGSLDMCVVLIENYASQYHKQKLSTRLKPDPKVKACAVCSANFIPKMFAQKYCSSRCGTKAETEKRSKKPKVKICKHCQKEFTPYTSLSKYCSHSCRFEGEREGRKIKWSKESRDARKGMNNPAYRNGMYVRGSKKSAKNESVFVRHGKEIRESIKNQYGYILCEHCQINESARWEIHHIIYRSEKPGHDHLHDKRNLINLCIACHNEFHRNKGARDQLVIDRGLHLLFGSDVLNKSYSRIT